MTQNALVRTPRQLRRTAVATLPRMIIEAGDQAARRFFEFFTANIRNKNTREAYARAVSRFCLWCEERGLQLDEIEPVVIAAYIEELTRLASRPTVKQHLAAIRMLFDYLVTGQIVPFNPASSVRGPSFVAKKGRTPILTAEEARHLLDSIDVEKLAGLRDRALIGTMVYSFARVSAVITMRVEDCFIQQKRMWFRLHEKGGKRHEVPAHHNAEAYMHAYLDAAGIAAEKKTPVFRTFDRRRQITDRGMHRNEVLAMIKRRAKNANLPPDVCCHTFRATGITTFLENGGSVEKAQRIAAHESPRTTKLYDRTDDKLKLDDIEMVRI